MGRQLPPYNTLDRSGNTKMIITKKSSQLDIAAGLENILFNAGTMVKNKGFRKAKAYLVEQINEAYLSSLELPFNCEHFFNAIGNVKSCRTTGNLASLINHGWTSISAMRASYEKSMSPTRKLMQDICQENRFSEIENNFAKMLQELK